MDWWWSPARSVLDSRGSPGPQSAGIRTRCDIRTAAGGHLIVLAVYRNPGSLRVRAPSPIDTK